MRPKVGDRCIDRRAIAAGCRDAGRCEVLEVEMTPLGDKLILACRVRYDRYGLEVWVFAEELIPEENHGQGVQ